MQMKNVFERILLLIVLVLTAHMSLAKMLSFNAANAIKRIEKTNSSAAEGC